MDPVRVRLSKPIRDFGKEITEVCIEREVNGGDLVAIDGMGKNAATLKLIERLCGLSWEACLRLPLRDIQKIEEAMAPFAGTGPETGGLPSDT